MKSLYKFIDGFFKNKGHYVFLSLLIAKICGFLGSVLIIRILPESEFGTISIVASIFFIFVPFSGFGSHLSLLRYGSLSQSISEKQALSKYLLKKGFYFQLILTAIFLSISLLYINKYEYIFIIFLFFGVRLMGFYFLNQIQVEFRIAGNNKSFARVSNFVNIGGVLLLLVLSYYFGLIGYLFAVVLAPFLSLFWFTKDHLKRSVNLFNSSKKEIRNFGLHAASTNLLSETLFSVDVLILSFLLNESAVANYKVALLIPANITFLAASFMQSDYTILAHNSKNKSFLRNYIFNYYKLFIPISFFIIVIGYLFKVEILTLFFSFNYAKNDLIFTVLLVGFALNMLLWNLYGTLLSAVGLMKYNTFISFLTLLFLIIFSLVLVKMFGILGMALSLSSSMFIAGNLMMILFYLYWKKLK